jgi:hypothetical protein
MFDFIARLPPSLVDVIGVIGFSLYVMNYCLLTFHRLTSHSELYFMINLMAASIVLIWLTHSFNLASALIQLFWIAISTTAIVLRLRQSRTGQSRMDQSRSADSERAQSQRLMPDARDWQPSVARPESVQHWPDGCQGNDHPDRGRERRSLRRAPDHSPHGTR